MTTPLRWGIIGTGGIAHKFARDLEYVDALVEAVGSRSQESADAFGDEFGVAKRYGSYQSVEGTLPHGSNVDPFLAPRESGARVTR